MSDVLLQIEDLHLVFKVPNFARNSVRDHFVQMVQNPFGWWNQRERLHVLRGVTCSLKRGDRVGILGINGAGKSSLLRCIAGLYHSQRGRICAGGQVRAIFDVESGFNADLTGRENAELLVHLIYQPYRARFKEILQEALSFSELGDFLDTPYRIYSNGMKARLALSIVSALPADILLLDEVFDGADRFFQEKISRRLQETIHQSGAVMFVSHSLEQIRRVCNRVFVLKDGRIEFDGPVEEGIAFYLRESSSGAPRPEAGLAF